MAIVLLWDGKTPDHVFNTLLAIYVCNEAFNEHCEVLNDQISGCICGISVYSVRDP